MKSKKKQRILALLLSMVLMLSASISAMAEGDAQNEASGTETTENQAAAQSLEEETVPETEVPGEENGIAVQSLEGSEEPVQETEESVEEVPSETTVPAEEEVAETPVEGENSQEYVPQQEIADQTGVENIQMLEDSVTVEETPEQEQPEEVISPATELKQEFTDENGNVTQTVTAYLPEGAFQATADQISMEVKLLNEDDTNYIKGMMEEKLPEGFYLDGYVLYQIDFKVNGEITRPAKAITISMTGNELAVEDTKNAHVFYYVPEDPEVEGDEDQLTEVTQKDQMIKSLEESGQSTENIEDYDYAEIAVNEGNADTITVKGWESTIYGCYVEKEMAQEVTYEDDTVKVTVSAGEKGIIPNKTTLQVVPISNSGDTKEQYKEVEKKLQEKAESEEYEIAGFLAYDISFVDKDGNEVEPNGEVRVSLEYKEAVLPEGLTEEEAKEADVTMLHLEEDEKGKVKDVVDMAEKEQVEAIATTESQQVEKVAVKTESFSTFTLIWQSSRRDTLSITCISEDGSTNLGTASPSNKTISSATSVEDIAPSFDNYTFDRAVVKSYYGQETRIYYLRYQSQSWQYNTDSNASRYFWSSVDRWSSIYFIYTQDTQALSGIEIVDDIASDGYLRAEVNDEIQEQIDQAVQAGETVTYVWSKSEYGSQFSEVELEKSGSDYNIAEDGKALDVIIDGADKEKQTKYKVAVYIGDSEQPIAESVEYEIPYYKQIQNGSFETPVGNKQWSNKDYKEEGGVWQTTGLGEENDKKGKDIEIKSTGYGEEGIGDGFMAGADSDQKKAADGKQYAEINCETSGALYQDVLTDKNVELNYYLSHRARSRSNEGKNVNNKFDTMYLVIMPTNDAGKYTTHEDLVKYLNGLLGNNEIPIESTKNKSTKEEQTIIYNKDGVLIARITSNAADWQKITNDSIQKANGVSDKTYTPTSSLSRFFFISGATAAGDVDDVEGNTIGNLVDRIGFGQVPLPPESGTLEIEIEKTISGLTEEQFNELKTHLEFKITAKDPESGSNVQNAPLYNKTISASSMVWEKKENSDGTVVYEGKYSVTGQLPENAWDDVYFYQVTENNADVDTTTLNTSCDVRITGGTKKDDGAVLGEQDAAVFDFTNEYSPNYKTEPVNFFLNLSSKILDTDGQITGQDNGNFTTSVSGNLSATQNAQGIGIPINEDLLVKLPSDHEHKNDTVGVIAGTSSTSAKEVDEKIRALKNGTNGNQEGHTEETYQIIDEDGNGAFPTDEEIFQYIRDNWDYKYTYNNVTSDVHKGKDITVNGIAIDKDKLTTENFAIRWYVFKDQKDDCWHIDGILVPKSGVLNVTKTFENEEIANLLNENNFSIDVTGNFLSAVENGEATISNTMDSAKKVVNRDGTVTYSWSLAIFGEEYKVEEKNHNLDSDGWIYSKTEYVYTSIEGNAIKGESASVTIRTERQFDDEGKKSQTLAFSNYYTANAKLDLKKVSANSETPIPGAEFKLSKFDNGKWVVINEDIQVNNEDNSPEELSKLIPGSIYKLEETLAPNAYMLLGKPIYFKVSGGFVELCDEGGNALDTTPDMWSLSEDGLVLTIKNTPAYGLPSAGGPGIFLYMIGGTLLLMAGSLMIYINRRRGGAEKIGK